MITKCDVTKACAKRVSLLRKRLVELIYRSRSAHIGSSLSVLDVLVSLYFGCFRTDQGENSGGSHDRFILSKGHACAALYITLAEKGIITENDLERFACDCGTLEQHPTRNTKLGIEVSSGSLGHGLSIGCGMAIAGKRDGNAGRVFVLMSDGEINEGSIWEAAMLSAHQKLDNLVGIVDYNQMQALGRTYDVLDLDPLAEKWRSFGWAVMEVDGHNISELVGAYGKIPFHAGKPSMIIARTILGKGISFMEGNLLWHYRCPDDAEYQKALKEVSK